MTPVVIRTDTLGDLLREEIGLYAWCNSCGRAGDLDVLALAVAHGEACRVERLAGKLRCRNCGAAGRLPNGLQSAELRLTWPYRSPAERAAESPDSGQSVPAQGGAEISGPRAQPPLKGS